MRTLLSEFFRVELQMIIDAHAHLNDDALTFFVKMMGNAVVNSSILVFSNSVDYQSSLKNIELASTYEGVKAFVGVHPEIFARDSNKMLNKSSLDDQVSQLGELVKKASGVGEIGLDEKYGAPELQEYLLEKMLTLAEPTRLPVTFHSRGSISKIRQILSTFNIRGNVLFHWFAGSEIELRALQENGMYVSFGPSILYSKRLSQLAKISDSHFTLAETDAPTRFTGMVNDSPGTPVLASSVVFKMAMIWGDTFPETLQITNNNALRYLETQH